MNFCSYLENVILPKPQTTHRISPCHFVVSWDYSHSRKKIWQTWVFLLPLQVRLRLHCISEKIKHTCIWLSYLPSLQHSQLLPILARTIPIYTLVKARTLQPRKQVRQIQIQQQPRRHIARLQNPQTPWPLEKRSRQILRICHMRQSHIQHLQIF